MRVGVYPGSFDPLTNGHLDIIKRASMLVDKLIIGIFINPSKTPEFSIEERIKFIELTTSEIQNIEVCYFTGLLVDFMSSKNASVIIRGLRALSDFEYEFQIALANRKLNEEIETVFLMTSSENAFVSSSLVREIAKFGGDVDKFVPNAIVKDIIKKYNSI